MAPSQRAKAAASARTIHRLNLKRERERERDREKEKERERKREIERERERKSGKITVNLPSRITILIAGCWLLLTSLWEQGPSSPISGPKYRFKCY